MTDCKLLHAIFMDYNKVWFSPSRKREKTVLIFLEGVFFQCMSKPLIFNKEIVVPFQARSSEMLDFFVGWHSLDIY